MEQYINLKGFENSYNGTQLKNSNSYIIELNVIFYDIPLLFIEYEIQDPEYIGENTPLDKLYYANDQVVFKSISAMSPDWNGVEYSRKIIDKIKPKDDKEKGFDPHYIYEENEIKQMKE